MHDAPAGLVLYDRMVTAIERCYQVDEVKDLRDRAFALEQYARQAQNVEAERKAIEVRIRAERRAGELLKEMERGQGQRNDLATSVHVEPKLSEYQEAKTEANISDTQAKRWQRLAEIPRVDFEQKLADPLVRPTTTGLIQQNQPKQAPDEALWLWGHLREFERRSMFQTNINDITSQMSEALQSDMRRIAPQLIAWIDELEGI